MKKNIVPIGIIKDIINLSAYDLHKKFNLEKPEWKIVNAIHDELLFSVPEKDVTEAKKIIEDVMVTTSSKYSKIPIPVEFSVGDSWEK